MKHRTHPFIISLVGGLACLLQYPLAIKAQEKTDYQLVELGDSINSRYHDSAPLVTPDGNRLYFFVSDHPENSSKEEKTQDIWYSNKQGNGY